MPAEFVHRFDQGTSPFTLLTLHGTGGDENDLPPVGRMLLPAASILSPRGNVLENGAPSFFGRTAPGIFDADEIRTRAAELAQWIRWATGKYQLDDAKIFALGYANGANIASSVMLLHPGIIAGAVLLRPAVAIEPDPLPDLKAAPVLICAGKVDSITPPGDTEKVARMLTEAGATVDLAMQNAGHDLLPQDFAVVKRWLAETLK
jgi:phospholipase/carboxylesterase